MYIMKEEEAEKIKRKYRQNYIAEEVGLSITYISLILSGKKSCPKRTAYCITKTIDENSEIEDLFVRVK